MPLDINKTLGDIKSAYKESGGSRLLRALVVAEKGAGKTSLFKTCPKPVLVFSFDPGGTEVLRDEIEGGDIIVDSRYESDDPTSPKAFKEFWQNYVTWQKEGLYERFATVGIDSLTMMVPCAVWYIQKKEGRQPSLNSDRPTDDKKEGMRIQDWGTLATLMQQFARSLRNVPCHTILTGHIGRDMDEVTRSFVRTILLPGQSKDNVPNLIANLLCLTKTSTPQGLKRELLTQDFGEYKAACRLGGKVEGKMPPDIKGLLEAAGYDSSDKPKLEVSEEDSGKN